MASKRESLKPCPLCNTLATGEEWPTCENEECLLFDGVSIPRDVWQALYRVRDDAAQLVGKFEEACAEVYGGEPNSADALNRARAELTRACIFPRVSDDSIDALRGELKELKELLKKGRTK